MMILLLPALLVTLWAEAARCLEEDGGFQLQGNIRHFAVLNDTIYIASEEMLYQLSHDLTLVQSVTQRGILTRAPDPTDAQFTRVSETDKFNATFSVNVLLPHVDDGNLIVCGVTDNGCGYCELLDLRNISNVVYRENIQVGSLWRSSASVSFLVSVKTRTRAETYILTAVQQYKVSPTPTGCPSVLDAVHLFNTNDNQVGLIFSPNSEDIVTPAIKSEGDLDLGFVDGFQINSIIYLFSNVPSEDKSNKVRLLWFEDKGGKFQTLKSLRGATLRVSDGQRGHKLISSSVIRDGPPGLWSGVFTVDEGQKNTELLVFDISPDLTSKPDTDPDFCSDCGESKSQPKILKPMKVIFKQKHMTSVLAVRQKDWIVFFIGTGDGQLIKLAVDKNFQATCPKVLFKTKDDHKVFSKLHLDQVDLKHVYVPFQNQINRVPVSDCNTHKTVQDCWSAQDPYCGWCSSKKSCTFKDDCKDPDWLSIPDDSQKKMVSYKVSQNNSGQITLNIQMHVTVDAGMPSNFTCQFSASSSEHFIMDNQQFPQCTFILQNTILPAKGLPGTLRVGLGSTEVLEKLNLFNCTNIRGPPTPVLCQQCIEAGCGWATNRCSWANQGSRNDTVCQTMASQMNLSKPEIYSITPSVVSFYGRNHAVLNGSNLGAVTGVRIQTGMYCTPKEIPVGAVTHENLTFHIPPAEKGVVQVCVALTDGSCHGNAVITYQSAPSCTELSPTSSWISGKRKITLSGTYLEFVEAIIHSQVLQEVSTNTKDQKITYDSPAAENAHGTFSSTLTLRVANETLACSTTLTYYPDPEFTGFSSTTTGDDNRITIHKKLDKLNITLAELSVRGIHENQPHSCIMEDKEINEETEFFICEVKNTRIGKFQEIKIQYGGKTITLKPSGNLIILMVLVPLLIPVVIAAVVIIYQSKQKKLTAKMNKRMEELELDIRNDIRQGFVDLQTEKADLMENVGAIPFLDYKHFASRIFFPESESLMKLCIKDIGQDGVKVQLDESCKSLSRLIQDQLFLTSMVHALEEQKSFTIKDKCALASLLTVALHNNLSYLTEVMEALLRALMQQNSNTQPKLLLRRTESTVEKLLTNWMSICLYGFLRETVGQHLFLMVSAITQQTAKGPVDCVTEKALYTLSEDWLLWQAQDFTSLKLKVLFAVGTDGEVSEPLEVNALSCDSIEQVKEKILTTFKAKFGFPYNITLREACIEFEKDGVFVPLEEVDASSEVIGDVTMLNTLKHYKVPDGATIKVLSRRTHAPLSPQGSLKDDENFSGKYFHLIDPDVDEDHRKSPERKKLKVKEVYLTKLLSTKVAVHSFVENLFRSIWGMPHCRAPHAVKYFFDFLDTQAENMKINDPDVLHIWKTNSLPLRFWINILKNPQFVFDMEKTSNLDGCLSVIAQAFMDSFSLSETQLGKYAPTNKLLYAKDIPKFKQEVKVYYKQIRDQPPITDSEFKQFLLEESKKHENEFNEAAALRELFKFIQRYFTEIKEKLDQNGAPAELTEQLHDVKNQFDGLKSCSWN